MKDFRGKELCEGDEVIFVLKRSRGKGEILLSEGVIKQFHSGNAYIQPKDTNWAWGCKGKCIMKI